MFQSHKLQLTASGMLCPGTTTVLRQDSSSLVDVVLL